MKRFEARKAALLSMLLLGICIILPGCGRWNNPAPPPSGTTVSSTAPINGAGVVAIGNKLTATFSEPMDSASINAESFTLRHGATKDTGTVSYSGVTAVFAPPVGGLLPGTLYTATITTGARDLNGLALAADYSWSFTTGVAGDTTKPTVSSTSPADNATGVLLDNRVSATFSEPMDPATITTASFTLKHGTTPVPGALSYSNGTAVLTPTTRLAASTLYTAAVNTGAKDLGGNALGSDYSWTFTTGTTSSVSKPTVLSTTPAPGVTGVATGNKVGATFSTPMDPLTITTTTFSLKRGTVSVAGSVASSGVNATFAPASPLLASTQYSATISTGAKDLAGNALASDYIWNFTTGTGTDLVRPSVTLSAPADAATNVPAGAKVIATFSESMDPLTINTGTFTVAGISGTVTYNDLTKQATFTPTLQLAGNTTYFATVTSGAQDSAGNPLNAGLVANPWSFTTQATPVVPAAVNLLSIAPFGAAGGTGVTSCGNTVITGDVSTTSAPTLITGLTDANGLGNAYSIAGCPGIVNGKIYTAPPAPGDLASQAIANQAQIDAQTAFNATSPASMPGATVQTAELGGLTLAPGVYWTSTSFNITTVDLTLDAKGDPNAFWVFQSESSLTVGTNVKVILTNAAQAKNVFWHVSSAATINAGAQMKGTILAFSGVSMSTGARLDGRAIAMVGGPITLLNNIIVIP